MFLSTVSALVLPAVAIPTTNVGKPAAAAAVTASTAMGSSVPGPPPDVRSRQVGCPSVASSRNLGFGSVNVRMYSTPTLTAWRVGVDESGSAASMAALTAPALLDAIGISTSGVTPQPSLPKSFSPQLTVPDVWVITSSTPAVICDHLLRAMHAGSR